jgi:hypothetical protein
MYSILLDTSQFVIPIYLLQQISSAGSTVFELQQRASPRCCNSNLKHAVFRSGYRIGR